MNVFDFDIWKQVKHDGQFSHTVTRKQTVHALNEERARARIKLEPGYTNDHLEVSGEFIYQVKKCGTVTIQPFYVYSDGRLPRPV